MQGILTGSSNFKEIRENEKLYIDKTNLVKKLVDEDEKITLITRQRRFGKTLNMMMLKEYFDISKDSLELFKRTKYIKSGREVY